MTLQVMISVNVQYLAGGLYLGDGIKNVVMGYCLVRSMLETVAPK